MKHTIRLAGSMAVPWLLVLLASYLLPAQGLPTARENCAEGGSEPERGQNVRILFWNVENLFDYKDDTVTADEEFTSSGSMHWSFPKLQTKIAHVAKTILAAGELDPPAIIGMCEVENRYVLNKLVYDSPLKPFGYRIIHRDSPDSRGIDVAMLYRPDRFDPFSTQWIRIRFPFDSLATTREILYAKGLLMGSDTIHIFINHWPSRRGGEQASAPRRNFVASVLRAKADSILQSDVKGSESMDTLHPVTGLPHHFITSSPHHPFILIMGDFNDEPENESLASVLHARLDTAGLDPGDLVNLMHLISGGEGSHKFREHWGLLDQFIISGSLLDTHSRIRINPPAVRIFRPTFLLEDDPKYLGVKPKRTYLGPRYKGGFSDHLPIIMEIFIKIQ